MRYRLGDKVLVRVTRVNLDDKKIDLEMVLGAGTPKKSAARVATPAKAKPTAKKVVKKKKKK